MGAPARNKLKTWAWLRPDCSWLLSSRSHACNSLARKLERHSLALASDSQFSLLWR